MIGDEDTNQIVSNLCAEASNASWLRKETTGAELSGEEFAPGALACWIGLSSSLSEASGAKPVAEQVSRRDPTGDAEADDGAWAWVDEGAVPEPASPWRYRLRRRRLVVSRSRPTRIVL